MRKQVVALLLGALAMSACGSAKGSGAAPLTPTTQSVVQTTTTVAETTTTTTTVTTLPSTTSAQQATTVSSTTTTTQPEIDIGTPVEISISSPSTNIRAEIYPHGPRRGEIFSPEKNKVGWWTGNGYVAPGEQGAALLAGHVTDVFSDLVEDSESKQLLSLGFAEVTVIDDEGTSFVFKADSPFREFKNQIPWDQVQQVYPERVLWLFTCGGTDEDGDGHREWNDVIRTTLDRIILPDGTVIDVPEEGS